MHTYMYYTCAYLQILTEAFHTRFKQTENNTRLTLQTNLKDFILEGYLCSTTESMCSCLAHLCM